MCPPRPTQHHHQLNRHHLEKLSLTRQELEAVGVRGREELAAAAWHQVDYQHLQGGFLTVPPNFQYQNE